MDLDNDELRYSAEHHLWVRLDDYRAATIGICEDYLEDGLEIRKLQLPSEGDEVVKDDIFGRITTTGAGVLRLYAPVSGEITEVNEDALDSPDVVLEDPYQDGWLIRIELTNMTEFDELMTRDEYEETAEELELDEVEIDDDHSFVGEDDDLDEDEEDEDDYEEDEVF